LARFALERSRGAKLIDIGCMQINQHWNGSHIRSVAEMFDPEQNVEYAASYLKSTRVPGRLLSRDGAWQPAGAADLCLRSHRPHGRQRRGPLDP